MKKSLVLMLVIVLTLTLIPSMAFAADQSEVQADADVTFTIIITPTVDFGTINKTMGTQSRPFSVKVENAFIQDDDSITVRNVTGDMNMYDNSGAGSNKLGFALSQPDGLFTFTDADLADGTETIGSNVTCNPSEMQYAGEYRGHMTFEISYVDNLGYDFLVDSSYTGTPGTVTRGAAQYSNIAAALAAAESGDKIMLAAGTYSGNVTIDKSVTIMGEGDSTVMMDEFIVKAPHVTIANLKINGNSEDTYSIRTEGLQFDANNISGLVIDRVTFDHPNLAVLLPASNTTGVDNSAIANGITIKNCTFLSCKTKGIYMEKGSNVLIENNTFIDCGNTPDEYINRFGCAIDVNLKFGVYTGLTIRNNTFTNNGNFDVANSNGGAILLKARGTGGDSDYSSWPASLTGISITGNEFYRNRVALSIGEPGKNNGAPAYDLTVFESGNTFGTDADANIIANYIDNR